MNPTTTSPQRSVQRPCSYYPRSKLHLNRRWSLDNLSFVDSKEGYIRDLRKQQQLQHGLVTIRDEEYPFMVTEQEDKGGTAGVKVEQEANVPTSRILHHKVGLRINGTFFGKIRFSDILFV